MPDLLTHLLVAYTVCALLSWRYEWLTEPYVTIAILGAFIPDLVKINLLVSTAEMWRLLPVPFSWTPLHTLGGSFVSVTIGVTLARHSERIKVAVLLLLGATTHFVADSFLQTPTGTTGPFLWPLWPHRLSMPGLYLSTDPRVTVVAASIAALVFVVTRWRNSGNRE